MLGVNGLDMMDVETFINVFKDVHGVKPRSAHLFPTPATYQQEMAELTAWYSLPQANSQLECFELHRAFGKPSFSLASVWPT